MYLDYYQLSEKPFTLSPNPKYLYYSSAHKEALSQMIYAVTEKCGFMALIGEVGTGKTMLVNALLKTLSGQYAIASINYTALTPKGLIQAICLEYRIAFQDETTAQLIFKLQNFFKERHAVKDQCILIVDEAQNLSDGCLEILRLLTNTQDTDSPYLQILFAGQQELDRKLNTTELRQLRERLSLRCELRTLRKREVGEYIRHRVSVAGYRNEAPLFSEDAVKRIHELTQGVPRRINIICDNAMICAYSLGLSTISSEVIEQVGAEYVALVGVAGSPAEADDTAIPMDFGGENDSLRQEPSRNGNPSNGKSNGNIGPSGGRDNLFPDSMAALLAENDLAIIRKPGKAGLALSLLTILLISVLGFLGALILAVKLEIL